MIVWLLGGVLGIVALFFVTMYGASELGGEVVTLDRIEANGDVSKVRIWIVDSDGMSWIEHGDAGFPWIIRCPTRQTSCWPEAAERTPMPGHPNPALTTCTIGCAGKSTVRRIRSSRRC